ncbi:hypothetical protein [Pseudonocardia zijingensis]|uniref:Uncharacterized protein n=1 Tax=Pseudonocardia zijingensis TaxID=153376 RepID=A0ABP3YL93_9PSEU
MANPQCKATAKSTGNRCTQPAVPGAEVCRFHGGAAPQVRAAAAQRVVEQQVRRLLADLEVPAVEDPFTELAKVAGQVVAWKDALADLVNRLVEDAPCEQCGATGGRLRYESFATGAEQLRSEVSLFERAMDRCAHVLTAMAKLNIDERLARITDLQAQAVLRAIDVALSTAGVTGAAADEARAAGARELRKAPA